MQYDFWNNPLVVSAMRLKYRRSSPGIIAAIYALLLLMLGGVLLHYEDQYSMPPGQVFLLVMFSLQTIISGLIAISCVAGSIQLEVTNRTLDFQRIVSLSPREILLGKMIGEPALSYFTCLATIPFAVLAWLVGSVGLGTIAWFYINIITFTVLAAALGTMHTFLPNQKTTAWGNRNQGGSAVLGFIWLPFVIIPQMIGSGSGWLYESWMGTLVNLITPIGALQHLYLSDPWESVVALWGFEFPSLIVAPVVQLALAYWIVTSMARRLNNQLTPSFARRDSYLVLLVFDLIVSGVCVSRWLNGVSTVQLLHEFSVAHVVMSLVLLLGIVPNKAALSSWLWRYRNQQSWLRDSSFGTRSEVTMVLFLFGLIGAVVAYCGFVLPTHWMSTQANAPASLVEAGQVIVVSFALVFGLGMMHQWISALIPSYAALTYIVCLLLIVIVPIIISSIMVYPRSLRAVDGTIAAVASLSPVMYFGSQIADATRNRLPAIWLIASSVLIGVWCYFALRRTLAAQQTEISSKLTGMGVDFNSPEAL